MGSRAVLVKGLRTVNDTITETGTSTERINSGFADWSVLLSQGCESQSSPTERCSP